MTATRTLRLTFLDDTGEAYHEATLAPAAARELLRRSGVSVVRIGGEAVPVSRLSYKTVAGSSRAAVADAERGNTVLIVLGDD